MSRAAFLERRGDDGAVLAIAHRGGAGAWPENTLPAFENSVGLGYRYLETDVHASVDGQLFAFHDDHLGRVSPTNAYIGDMTATEIANVDVAGERVPRLEEILLSWPDVRINLDPKSDAAVEPLARLLNKLDVIDRVCIGSFSDRRIDHLRQRFGPELCTSMGPREVLRLFLHSKGLGVGDGFAPCAQIPTHYFRFIHLTTAKFISRAKELGVEIHVWTIDEPDEINALIDSGVGGIMTDRPAVLREVLVQRGDWRAPALVEPEPAHATPIGASSYDE